MKVGDRIRAARQKLGWSQEKLGAMAGGRNVTQINGYECGRSNPSLPVLTEIAAALGVRVEELSGQITSTPNTSATVEGLLEEFKERFSKAISFDKDRISIQITFA